MNPNEFNQKHGLNLDKHLYKKCIDWLVYEPPYNPKRPNLEIYTEKDIFSYNLCLGCPIINYIKNKFKGFETISSYKFDFSSQFYCFYDIDGLVIRCYKNRIELSQMRETVGIARKDLDTRQYQNFIDFMADLRDHLYLYNRYKYATQ